MIRQKVSRGNHISVLNSVAKSLPYSENLIQIQIRLNKTITLNKTISICTSTV